MINWISYFVGVASSLSASYLLFLFDLFYKIVPPRYRKSFDREFKNQKKALRHIRRDARHSNTLRVISMKGDTFSSPGEAGELHDLLYNGPNKQKYLISSPTNSYVEKRAKELNNNNFRMGIENSIGCFKDVADKNPNIEVRCHEEMLRFRLIIFDNCLYFSFQSTDTPGRLSPMQRYKSPSSGYSALEAYFEDLWKKYDS